MPDEPKEKPEYPTYALEIPGMKYAEYPPVEIPPRVMKNFVITPKDEKDA
jgi:hypothetical protein